MKIFLSLLHFTFHIGAMAYFWSEVVPRSAPPWLVLPFALWCAFYTMLSFLWVVETVENAVEQPEPRRE